MHNFKKGAYIIYFNMKDLNYNYNIDALCVILNQANPRASIDDSTKKVLYASLETQLDETIHQLGKAGFKKGLTVHTEYGKSVWSETFSFLKNKGDSRGYEKAICIASNQCSSWSSKITETLMHVLFGLAGYPYLYYLPSRYEEACDKLVSFTSKICRKKARNLCENNI